MKHTKGKVEVRKWDGEQWPDKRWSVGQSETNGKSICISPRYMTDGEEAEANAELIAEAFNVANECGLTPRELLAQRDELIKVVKQIISNCGDATKTSIDILKENYDLSKQAINNTKK